MRICDPLNRASFKELASPAQVARGHDQFRRPPRSPIRTHSIVRPMFRAVPSIVLIAASRLVVFKSGIFVLAISSILAREILPTFSLFGLPDPFSTPAAFFNRSAAGGVFVSKVKEPSP